MSAPTRGTPAGGKVGAEGVAGPIDLSRGSESAIPFRSLDLIIVVPDAFRAGTSGHRSERRRTRRSRSGVPFQSQCPDPVPVSRPSPSVPSQSQCPVPVPVSRPSRSVPSQSQCPVPVPVSRPSPSVPSQSQSQCPVPLTVSDSQKTAAELVRIMARAKLRLPSRKKPLSPQTNPGSGRTHPPPPVSAATRRDLEHNCSLLCLVRKDL